MKLLIDKRKFGCFLKRRRQKMGLSQGEVAKYLGFSTPQFVSNWERGLVNPSLEVVFRLQGLYDIEDGELMEFLLKEVEHVLVSEKASVNQKLQEKTPLK